MLALEPLIVDRLRATLPAGWTVMGFSTDKGRRDGYPLASVLFADGSVADSKAGAASVQAAWRVLLVERRGDDAADTVDAAFAAAMAGLHGWTPGSVGGRLWERLRLLQVASPQYAEDGVVGVELTFNTHARFDGQNN